VCLFDIVIPALRTSFVRQQSTLAKSLDDDTESTTSVPSQTQENVPTADTRLYSSLKGTIDYDTWKALTVKPYKYTEMTAVQAAVFEHLPGLVQPHDPSLPRDGSQPPRDLLVKAKTGTGKTAAFVVPAIEHRLNSIKAHCRQVVQDAGLTTDKHMAGRAKRDYTREHAGSLIISPTRELAAQIAQEAVNLSHHHDDFEVRLFVGGSGKLRQMREWTRGRRDLVVATPGRIRDVLSTEPEVAKGLSKTPLVRFTP
jgi:ATP-dependent RNA helicase MSS116, mitochondrial